MRKLTLLVTGTFILGGFSQAHAIDNVETAIMKCRTSANTQAEQVACLETALRLMVPSTGQPDWAGTTSRPAAPNTNSTIATRPEGAARGLGAEQVESNRENAREKLLTTREQSVVADFAYNQNDRLILVLANGQVWKQRTGDLNYVRLEKGDTPQVIVRPGAVSGYRIEFPQLGQTIIVSRIQ